MTPWIAVVGGFLGAGKTTLILKAAQLLESRGVRTAVILNDQGEDLVDTELAHAHGVSADEVTGGCFCCQYADLSSAVDRLREFDVIFAEPVGSCTDLAATVMDPLLRSDLRVAPFTVVVDPTRELKDPHMEFLYRNQLAEADLVCVTRCDIAPVSDIPGRRVSGKTGQGVAEWLDEIFGGTVEAGAHPLDLDYEQYGAAETALAWLDARVTVTLAEALSPAMLIGPLLDRLDAQLNVVHLKAIDRTASGYLKASVAGKGAEPAVDGDLTASPASRHELLLNIRALDAPETLEAVVRRELPDGAAIRLKSFRPNAPKRSPQSMSAPSPASSATQNAQVDRHTPLGAAIVPGGATFRAWAPAALEMHVLTGDALTAARGGAGAGGASTAMFPLGDGTWAAFLPGAGEGTRYMFWVKGPGSEGLKRDPRARELTGGFPASDCVVRANDTYPWHDQDFRAAQWRDLILYQLHIGVFYAVDDEGRDQRRSVGKFLDVLDRVEYLRDLGVNGVQLLPVQEYPGAWSRGYNGVDLFSPEMEYEVAAADLPRYVAKANRLLAAHGRPPVTVEELSNGSNQLKCLIDILHLNGMAVLFDLVYNHAGGGWDDACLLYFDRQPDGDFNRSLYFTNEGWVGGLIFAYWNEDVRQFLIDNALACSADMHIDGIRYDEVTVIVGHGGGQFCRDLSSTLRYVHPNVLQIAEYWGDDRAAAVRPAPDGLGFDAAWGDRIRVGVRAAVRQSAGGFTALVDMGALAASFDTPPNFSVPWQVVNCLETHDIVYRGNDLRVPALADGADPASWYARSRSRFAAGMLAAARGIPMLFMGQESLEPKQWDDNVELHSDLLIDWNAAEQNRSRNDYLEFMTDLLAVRRNFPALRSDSLRVSRAESLDRVIAIHRWMEGAGGDVLVVGNLQEMNRLAYRVGFPGEGTWREVFNSDYYDPLPNPHTTGNGGFVNAEALPWDGFPASAEIAIPANGFIVFAR